MRRVVSLLAVAAIAAAAFSIGKAHERSRRMADIFGAEIFTVDEPTEGGSVFLAFGAEIYEYDLEVY